MPEMNSMICYCQSCLNTVSVRSTVFSMLILIFNGCLFRSFWQLKHPDSGLYNLLTLISNLYSARVRTCTTCHNFHICKMFELWTCEQGKYRSMYRLIRIGIFVKSGYLNWVPPNCLSMVDRLSCGCLCSWIRVWMVNTLEPVLQPKATSSLNAMELEISDENRIEHW
jgi:hypothetical protein